MRAAVALIAWGWMAGNAAAADDPGYRFTLKQIDSVLEADGSGVTTVHTELQALTPAAAAQLTQLPVGYNGRLPEFEITDAYTRKPDGRRLPVDKAAIVSRQAPSMTLALTSIYTDVRQMVIIFPNVEAGDTLVFDQRARSDVPEFARHLAAGYMYAPNYVVDSESVSISVPAAMNPDVDALGIDVHQDRDGDRVIYRWRRDRPPGPAVTPGPVLQRESYPHVYLSTLRSYDQFRQIYAQLIAPQFRMTNAIRQQADSITAGITDRREQANALYDWVSQRVRHVALELGISGLVPHPPEQTLGNAYGDCKDRTLLFMALLKARGIEAEPVLINSGGVYTLPALPLPSVFDHMIAWLPEFGLYADTTPGIVPFEQLPLHQYGKPVLHVGTTGAARRQVPLPAADIMTSATRTRASISDAGLLTVDVDVSATGPLAAQLRATALGMPSTAMQQSNAEAMLKKSNMPRALGRFTFAPTLVLTPQYSLSSHLQTTDAIRGNLTPLMGALRLGGSVGDILAGPLENTTLANDQPTACYSGRQVEDLTLDLAPGRDVLRLPADVSLASGTMQYSSHWRRDGQTITRHREFQTRFDQPLCDGEIRKQAANMLDAIRRDTAAPLILLPLALPPRG